VFAISAILKLESNDHMYFLTESSQLDLYSHPWDAMMSVLLRTQSPALMVPSRMEIQKFMKLAMYSRELRVNLPKCS
jgi:hypothetical protein